MAWIKMIDEDKAEGVLKEYYENIKDSRGKLANIHKIHSLNPESLKNHMDLYLNIMFNKSGLKREEREMIAVVVSSANKCPYCINHHKEALNYYWNDDEKLNRFIENYRNIDLTEKRLIMLEYAEKLTEKPDMVTRKYIEKLKKAGFNDQNILNINLIVSYFNFVNRIVMGLGVEYSEKEIKGYKY
ncbi:MAG: peroxidase-related enzyme [Candidatus Mcinerneyibacterium aminivorans]|uniref:Peroxidase-related enzyme n=1 Tax=Candidatus Mcinerneyibacterium aminivorans TaxID=2703815 RepID=A0A5D0MDS5_9BACT|nr:MAG: peroxidase-related enzyme [Candidatus Mcinerneyibacterium aminivorans]